MPRWTAESREHHSLLMRTIVRSSEWGNNISLAKKGVSPSALPSPEAGRKISAALRGRETSEAHRKNLSRALTGRKLTEEHRRKISEAKKGKRHTAESKLKLSLAHLNRGDKQESLYKRSGGFHSGVWMRCLNSEGVFARQLDRAGIFWLYEPRRFKLSLGSYLPDFFLPEFNVWVEVKGTRPEPRAFQKMEAFRRETGKCLIVVYQSDLGERKY